MSALGHKLTFRDAGAMSALPPKADIRSANTDVRFGPKADIHAPKLDATCRRYFHCFGGQAIGRPHRFFSWACNSIIC
jgi:hypothetical protein